MVRDTLDAYELGTIDHSRRHASYSCDFPIWSQMAHDATCPAVTASYNSSRKHANEDHSVYKTYMRLNSGKADSLRALQSVRISNSTGKVHNPKLLESDIGSNPTWPGQARLACMCRMHDFQPAIH
jgi:hypothetical protein